MNSAPIDFAYEHCLWAKRAGLSPHSVVSAVIGRRVLSVVRLSWLDAVNVVARHVEAMGDNATIRSAA